MKGKKMETRKRKALRRWGLTLLFLMLLGASGHYNLLPGQAMRAYERELGTGRMRVLWQTTDVTAPVFTTRMSDDWFTMDRLTANQNAVVLAQYGFGISDGWQVVRYYSTAVDCSGGAVVNLGWRDGWPADPDAPDTWDTDTGYIFGQVNHPAAESVRIESSGAGAGGMVTESADWFSLNGRRYFLMPFSQMYAGTGMTAIALDGQGRELGRCLLPGAEAESGAL